MYLIIHVLDLRIGELPAGLLGHVVIYDAFGETKIGEISPCQRSEKVGEVISYACFYLIKFTLAGKMGNSGEIQNYTNSKQNRCV